MAKKSKDNLEIELTYLNCPTLLIANISQRKVNPAWVGEMPLVLRANPQGKAAVFSMLPRDEYISFGCGADNVESCIGLFKKTGYVAREFKDSDYQKNFSSSAGDLRKYNGMSVRVLTYKLEKRWDEKEFIEITKK